MHELQQQFQDLVARFKRPPERLPARKGFLLFLLPLPVLLAAIWALGKSDLMGLAANAGSYALYLAGALITRQGMRNELDYERRKITRAPEYPLKTAGGALVGAATSITAFFSVGYTLPVSLCFGLGALLGFYMVYGFDPRAQKQAVDAYGLDATKQVMEALATAERNITAIEQAKREVRNPELNARLGRISGLAREILTDIEDDPRDLRRARKFLNVYLEGTQRVVEGYARTHRNASSAALEDNFRHVLVTIEDVFMEQRRKLLENDLRDLDIQIEVLATQLKREGVV
jgi:5-bromo-4-chloroindolyl phosphate hydrolysis protein